MSPITYPFPRIPSTDVQTDVQRDEDTQLPIVTAVTVIPVVTSSKILTSVSDKTDRNKIKGIYNREESVVVTSEYEVDRVAKNTTFQKSVVIIDPSKS